METYFVYILFSKKLNRYYIGSTSNLKRRLKEHLYKHRGFTARAKDWTIVYQEECASKNDAIQKEQAIKLKKSRSYIEFLIQQKMP